MTRPTYYVLEGHEPVPCDDAKEWAKWYKRATTDRSRIVEQTKLPGGVSVSTVFLGLDHNYCLDGPAILFETMTFVGGDESGQWRYATWEEAEAGHRRHVEEAKALIRDV